jgi:hypothetical protein
MPRFRLLAPHWLEVSGVPQLVEAGVEVDTSQLPPHFVPSPKMAALDGTALTTLALECQRIRRVARSPDIPGYGHRDGFSRAED